MIEASDIRYDDLPEKCQRVVDIIGMEAYLRLVEQFAGDAIYLPSAESVAREARNREIRGLFNGRNYAELARHYGLTVAWVRQIVGDGRARGKAAPAQMQRGLF